METTSGIASGIDDAAIPVALDMRHGLRGWSLTNMPLQPAFADAESARVLAPAGSMT
jgi:hypothetical protein